MLRTKDCVPAGGLAQVIAGEVPSPGAAPSAAWLNFTGISPPSGNPATVIVMAGLLAGGGPLRWLGPFTVLGFAAMGIPTISVIIDARSIRPFRILFLLIP